MAKRKTPLQTLDADLLVVKLDKIFLKSLTFHPTIVFVFVRLTNYPVAVSRKR